MKIQIKNKIFTILSLFTILCCSIVFILAATGYFKKEMSIPTKLPGKDGIAVFEVKETKRTDIAKILLPTLIPNFNTNKYVHKMEVTHKAELKNISAFDNKDVYLKITNSCVTHNTFTEPEKYFNLSIKINNTEYNKDKVKWEANKTEMEIQIALEQNQIIPNSQNDPKLDLKITYELVDTNGNSFPEGKADITTNQLK
ncbi:hypothetical protein CWO85_02515 [Candidatus Phytoplasma ziziphi]|uniref:Uncharacterized protein n=1 Tax=Ziziphus jujuba witches'-broom phytoplasma TaxID=135727 RepID=A0A660HMV3_ZIZJU|nr:hypothetical protein [Candidatus Phytoplasma ziziphi]AYJ01361.1 hypothetical protein CWO85_02515 [Candidatus Phytoplasma ziziphi]